MIREATVGTRVSLLALSVVLVSVTAAGAGSLPEWAAPRKIHEVRSVAGPRAISDQPLETVAVLESFLEQSWPELVLALEEARWEGSPELLRAAVEAGAIEERSILPGADLRWMAFRRDETVGVIEDVRWAGQEPLEAFETLAIDASRSRSADGELSKVVVEVFDAEGKKVQEIELEPPFKESVGFDRSGTLTYRAVAVDRHGQRSELPWEGTVVVRPRSRILAGIGYGHEQRALDESESEAERSSQAVLVHGGMSYLVRPNLEVAGVLGGAVNTHDRDDSGVFGDVELNWVRKWGFAGLELGVWDLTDDGRKASWLLHLGQDAGFEVAGWPLHACLSARFLLDSPGNPHDNFVISRGLRLRRR